MPFCKQCGAPQIRVVGAEPPAEAPAPLADSTEAVENPSMRVPAAPGLGRVQWAHALPGAALGGALSILGLVIPFAAFGPAFMLGGALAVLLYRRHLRGGLPSPGVGARVGAASGGFGFLFLIIPIIATLVYRPDELRHAMLTQLPGRGYDPQKVQQAQELLKTHEGLVAVVVLVMFVMLLVIVAGGCIGGALYAAWLRKCASL